MKTNTYVLESAGEFERLERQSSLPMYDYRAELVNFVVQPGQHVLDAGCGSGIVTRYLATQNPEAQFTGCDFSMDRVSRAATVAGNLPNLQFSHQNLTALTFAPASLDSIVCRYVFEHMDPATRAATLSEFYRCLKPGGSLLVIDIDGLLHNLYPVSPRVAEGLTQLTRYEGLDLNIGRKIPALLTTAGFKEVAWQLKTIEFRGQEMTTEIELCRERLVATHALFTKVLGTAKAADVFAKEYLEAMHAPEAVLFYNKFMVYARKPMKSSQKLRAISST